MVRHVLLDRFDPDGVDAFVSVAGLGSGSPVLSVEVRRVGGAAGRPAPSAGALSHIDAEYAVVGVRIPLDADFAVALDRHLRVIADTMAGYGRGRRYLNFVEEPTDTPTAFTPDTHRRLAAMRDRLDPVRRMRANHPIVPAA